MNQSFLLTGTAPCSRSQGAVFSIVRQERTVMEHITAVLKFVLVLMVVWRLAQLSGNGDALSLLGLDGSKPLTLSCARVIDCVSCLSVWMSAQATLWVVCGFTGVILNWVLISTVCRKLQHPESMECSSDMSDAMKNGALQNDCRATTSNPLCMELF